MTKHGHGLPRKRPGRSAKDEIEEELPQLEPLTEELPELEPLAEELPELEPVEDDGPVKARHAASSEDGFDVELTIEVPDMPKKDVPEHVEGPLARVAAAAAAQVRHKRVLVNFAGEALIGSAVKDQVATELAPHKPLLVVVRRGFGDERVHEGSLPKVDVSHEASDGIAKVEIETGDCEAADLPVAMEPHMEQLARWSKGARVVMRFGGAARPDATMRDALAMALRDAGARSAAIGARVLFDKDLEERVKCSVSGNRVSVAVSLTDDDATTVDALSLVLPNHEADIDGKNVRFQFARESSAVQAFCVDFAKGAGATLIEVGGADDYDIVWPPLISLRAGKEVELRLSPNGRSRAAVLAAFARECADHHTETQGKDVVVDWPADFSLDAEVLACLESVSNQLAARRVACTLGGADREPFLPVPVTFTTDGDTRVVRVDSEAGKPRELQRSVDRHLPAHIGEFAGQAVRIEVVGDAAVSRTLKNNLCTAVAEAGAMRLELAEGGEVDVLLPPMLAIAEGDAGIKVSIVVDGRDESQQQKAVARELEGVEVALQSVTIASSSAAQLVAAAVLEQGASQVVVDGPDAIRLHPPLFEAVEKKGKEARVVIDPTGDAAMDRRMLDRELDARVKELGLLVGATVTIAWPGADAGHDGVAALLAALRDKKASTVLLDAGAGDPVQLHPEPQPESPPEPQPEAAAEAPTLEPADEAPAPPPVPAAAAQPAVAPAPPPEGALLHLIARRDESVPPIVVVGVADGEDATHLAAVEAELQAHMPRFRGRAVLFVPHRDGVDAPVRRTTAMVQMLARVAPTEAAATLVFRGPDAQGRPHFQVLHSSLRALPVGGVFGDPRAAGQPT